MFSSLQPQPRMTPSYLENYARPLVDYNQSMYPMNQQLYMSQQPFAKQHFQSVVVNPQKPTPIKSIVKTKVLDPNADQIEKLRQQIKNLEIKLPSHGPKRPKRTNTRTSVWCANCEGHGHVANEYPSPPHQGPKCSYCGGNHEVTKC